MKYTLLLILALSFALARSQSKSENLKLAREAYNRKDYKTAIRFAEKSLKQDSAEVGQYFIKAESHIELKEHQEAFETYTKGLAVFPNSAVLYNNRGSILLSAKQFDFAIKDFSKAYELADKDSVKYNALSNRAAARMWKREFMDAYWDLKKAYSFDSTDIATLTNLGAVCDEIGRGDETLKYLQKVIDKDPKSYPAYINMGFKYQDLGKYKESIDYFNKALDINPKEPLGFSNRSYSKLKMGDLKGAMSDIGMSINLYPANSYAYRNRALIYIEQGKTGKACDDLQTAIDKGFVTSYGDEVLTLQKKHCKK